MHGGSCFPTHSGQGAFRSQCSRPQPARSGARGSVAGLYVEGGTTLASCVRDLHWQPKSFQKQGAKQLRCHFELGTGLELRGELHQPQGQSVNEDGPGLRGMTEQAPASPESGTRKRKTRGTASHASHSPGSACSGEGGLKPRCKSRQDGLITNPSRSNVFAVL